MRIAVLIGVLLLLGPLACGSGTKKGTPENEPPVIVGFHDTTATVGDTLWVDFDIYDSDGQATATSFGSRRSRHEIETSYWPKCGVFWDEYVFWYRPAVQDDTSRVFRIEARDDDGGVATRSFTVRIAPARTP